MWMARGFETPHSNQDQVRLSNLIKAQLLPALTKIHPQSTAVKKTKNFKIRRINAVEKQTPFSRE
jgi:hypothetical protein